MILIFDLICWRGCLVGLVIYWAGVIGVWFLWREVRRTDRRRALLIKIYYYGGFWLIKYIINLSFSLGFKVNLILIWEILGNSYKILNHSLLFFFPGFVVAAGGSAFGTPSAGLLVLDALLDVKAIKNNKMRANPPVPTKIFTYSSLFILCI